MGSELYNLNLSQRRADRGAYLVKQGVTSPITAVGYGEATSGKACEGYSKTLNVCVQIVVLKFQQMVLQ